MQQLEAFGGSEFHIFIMELASESISMRTESNCEVLSTEI